MSETLNVSTLIIGGGLAGLSAAYHLNDPKSLLIEREENVGGTARSVFIDGFTFDFTGHLLHLHNDYTKRLISGLLKGNVFRCQRKAWIFSHNTYTRYPFQANTHGLPPNVIDECVLGFLEAHWKRARSKMDFSKMNFADWCESIFGTGISEHFMWPYNRKLYQVPPKTLTVDWCGAFVPKVEPDEVIRGALEDQKKGFGYNTEFLYPKKGGIQVLAEKLGEKVKNIQLRTTVSRLDWKMKTAQLSDGTLVRYKNLINTIPLKDFLSLFSNPPARVKKAAGQLKAVGILCLNVGVNRAQISDASWIYIPEPKFPFYRVGFPMNFTPHVVPKGCSSMYVEIPFEFSKRVSQKELLRRVKTGLIEARILKPSDKWLVTQFIPIRTAYVVYDRHRTPALSTIFPFLASNRIQTIGRYGAWKYSFMEEAILDGKKAAEKIRD